MADRSSLFQPQTKSFNQSESRTDMKNYNLTEIKTMLGTAKSAVIVSPVLSLDSIAASLAFALSLKKAGLNVSVYSPQKTTQDYSKLSGLELITDQYSASGLTITLDYPLDSIDQVSYNDDNQKLNLVVKTKPNSPQIDNSKILINNQSSGFDIGFILGDETALGENSSIVNSGNWVFISPQNVTKTWAKATLVDPDAPFCEIFSFMLPQLGYQLDPDSAKNLLIGLRVSTQSFSVNVSPETFEAGAICLKATQTAPPASVGTPINPTPVESVESAPVSKFQSNPTSPVSTS